MGALLVATLSVVAFAVVLTMTGVVARASKLANVAMGGVVAMLDASLSDREKEAAVRKAGISLLGGAFAVGLRFLACFAAVFAVIYAFDFAGLVPQSASLGMLLRIDFIVIISVVAMIVWWLFSRFKGRAKSASEAGITDSSAYGAGDKFVHALAFAGGGALRTAARIDDSLHKKRIRQVAAQPPIFITSLARGGTTAILNSMHEMDGIATHLYRDMPFVAAPILWSRFAGGRKDMAERERAHGDGMKISLDSPEAFDEIFWRLHWPSKYSKKQIDLWSQSDLDPKATAFFERQMAKIAHLRQPERSKSGETPVRYLSKNNANLARLEVLPIMFEGCDIVVPLRGPAAHAASLHRQHINFEKIHAEDDFVKRYMRDIGHLEFGALQRPIGFDPAALTGYEPSDPNYWLAYWITAFAYLEAQGQAAHLVSQDILRANPQGTMGALMERLSMPQEAGRDFASHFRTTPDKQPDEMFDPALLAQARKLFETLEARAVR